MIGKVVSISSKGQITIPRNIRRRLNVKPGDKLVLDVKNGSILARSAHTIVTRVAGSLTIRSKKEAV